MKGSHRFGIALAGFLIACAPAAAEETPAQGLRLGGEATEQLRGAQEESRRLDGYRQPEIRPEGNGRAADSVYALVVERYPRSEQAPNALYKRASAARAVGQTQQANALYRQIVAQYPRSDAALLAQESLRERP